MSASEEPSVNPSACFGPRRNDTALASCWPPADSDESALLREVEIARFPESRAGGTLATTFRVSLDSTYLLDRDAQGRYLGPPGMSVPTGKLPEVGIQAYDQINVLRQPGWDEGGSVTLGGEVKYPGTYAIKNTGERISDILKRAGGLTDQGFAVGAVFRRQVDEAMRAQRDIGNPTRAARPRVRDLSGEVASYDECSCAWRGWSSNSVPCSWK